MPHYYFHLVYSDSEPVRDDDGLSFEDDDVAKREAMLSLGDLIKEASIAGPYPFCVRVQIVREGIGIIDLITGQLSTTA
jgi:hypothetical protein